jgi:hypothetical protein
MAKLSLPPELKRNIADGIKYRFAPGFNIEKGCFLFASLAAALLSRLVQLDAKLDCTRLDLVNRDSHDKPFFSQFNSVPTSGLRYRNKQKNEN